MRRSVFTAGLVAAFLLGLGTLGAGQTGFVASAQQKLESTEVKIDNFTFGPAALMVPVGTTVTWINKDEAEFTITAKDGSFGSKTALKSIDVKPAGDSYSFKFDKPGTHDYFGNAAKTVTGTIEVTP